MNASSASPKVRNINSTTSLVLLIDEPNYQKPKQTKQDLKHIAFGVISIMVSSKGC